MSEENNENSAPQRDQATQDWITGVKERKELQDKLAEKERENNILKGKIHEMTKKLEDLEKQVAEKNKEQKKRRKSSVTKPKRPAAKKREKGAKDTGLLTPDMNNKVDHDDPFEDPERLYAAIAERYSDLPLSTILFAEKRFVEADLDRNGTIDSDELEKMLDLLSQKGSSTMYTKKEVKDIFRKIDADNTNSIDFMEVLGVFDMLRQNKNPDLPSSLFLQQQQNKSTVCSIQ